jgi:hypothetical protein
VLPWLPYGRVGWRGVTLNRRTVDALRWVEKRSFPLLPAQGSYNKGVGASAGTHDGGGAIDLRVRQYTTDQRITVVRALKDAGFAAWYRAEVPGLWGPHIHALLIGDREMAAGARAQVLAFDAGRDGLRGNRPDPTYRPARKRWAYTLGRPVTR